MIMELFNADIDNAIKALECMIVDLEEYALHSPGGGDDATWNRVQSVSELC